MDFQRLLSNQEKEEKPVICNNRDGPRGRYAM